MSPEELLIHIGADSGKFFGRALLTWMKRNAAFRSFVERYRNKVRAKLRGCDTENKRFDLLWELEVAYLITKSSDFALQYERYESGTSRAPDYSVSHRLTVQFDAEVTRIRKTEAETGLNEWESEIKATIRAVPSDLGVSLSITAEFTPDLLRRLKAARKDITRFLAKTISSMQTRREAIGQRAVPGFEDELEILITKSPLITDRTHTSYYGADIPVGYSQREFTKFGDIICDKIRQFRKGTPNILIIGSDTDAHEFLDCREAIENLMRLAAEKNDEFFRKHGFFGVTDFLAQFAGLSGVVFRNRWRSDERFLNSIWSNPEAFHSLPSEIWEYLRTMD